MAKRVRKQSEIVVAPAGATTPAPGNTGVISSINQKLLDGSVFLDWITFSIPCSKENTFNDSSPEKSVFLKTINQFFEYLKVPKEDISHLTFIPRGFLGAVQVLEGMFIKYGSNSTINKNGDYTIQVDISGTGCRELERYYNVDWIKFIYNLLLTFEASFTRLDFSSDKFGNQIFAFSELGLKLRKGEYSSPSKSIEIISKRYRAKDILAESYYVGSLTSDRYLLIYDKNAERENSGYDVLFDESWLRFELRYKNKWAKRVARDIANIGFFYDLFTGEIITLIHTLAELFTNHLFSYLDVKEKGIIGDPNISREDTWLPWQEFIGQISKIQGSNQAAVETSITRKKNWVDYQVSKTLMLFIATSKNFEKDIVKSAMTKFDRLNESDLRIVNSELRSLGLPVYETVDFLKAAIEKYALTKDVIRGEIYEDTNKV